MYLAFAQQPLIEEANNLRHSVTYVMKTEKMVSNVNEEVLMYVRQLAERESKMQKELEAQYMLGIGDGYNDGYNDGYRDGLQEGFEKGRCETWDEAYSEGYKAAMKGE